MASDRDTRKYDFKVGNKVVHSGITNDLDRREREHQRRWPSGHIDQVGRATTREAARRWESGKTMNGAVRSYSKSLKRLADR